MLGAVHNAEETKKNKIHLLLTNVSLPSTKKKDPHTKNQLLLIALPFGSVWLASC